MPRAIQSQAVRLVYQPLKGAGEIRILLLLPSKLDSQLVCELEVVSLSTNVQYDTLSYVWGPKSGSVSIVCNGVAVAITDNLHDAL